MRWLLATTVLVLAATPGFAQQNDAEKLYRDFEKNLTATKAFKVTFEIEADDGPLKLKIRGELTVAAGNKMKLSFDGAAGDQKMNGSVVSDGKQMVQQMNEGGKADSKNEPVPEQLTALLAGFFARGGVFMALEGANPRRQQALDKFTVAGFKLGAKEKVGDKEAQVVEYTVDTPDKGNKGPLTCKLWLDVKTKMPLKRTVQANQGGGMQGGLVVEIYTNWQIDAKVRDGDFMLPK